MNEIIKQSNSTKTDSNIYIPKKKEDDIGLRPDSDGFLDDVFVKNVRMFRIERMNNNTWWLACFLENGEEIHWDMFPDEIGMRLKTRTEQLPKNVQYEKGSLLKELPERI